MIASFFHVACFHYLRKLFIDVERISMILQKGEEYLGVNSFHLRIKLEKAGMTDAPLLVSSTMA